MSWITFLPPVRSKSGKTHIWNVATKENYSRLGQVRWCVQWRRYVFMPSANTLFEQDCLREIAAFCEEETKKHKNSLIDPIAHSQE